METITNMNGRTLSKFNSSYALTFLVEDTFAKFSSLTNQEKINLCDRTDKLFSELFNIPRGEFIFEDREFSVNSKEIYIGKLSNIKTGAEFLFRYLFQKRQQFQRICIENKTPLDFGEDFVLLYESYNIKPISKEPQYIPFSKGLNNYLTNYNKIDALSFAFEGIDALIDMTDSKRLSSNMRLGDNLSLIWSVYKIRKYENKITKEINNDLLDYGKIDKKFKKYMKSVAEIKEEELFLKYLEDVLDGIGESEDIKQVFLCFHENVWENLTQFQKKQAVSICNELISNILKCNKTKNVKFNYGNNSYDFSFSSDVYIGDIIKDKPSSILQKLIYEYSFTKNYENILSLDQEDKLELLNEIEECQRIVTRTGDYGKIADYHFIKCVKKTAFDMQEKIYKYIDNNLVINGKKIKMTMSKEKFIFDLYKSKNRR